MRFAERGLSKCQSHIRSSPVEPAWSQPTGGKGVSHVMKPTSQERTPGQCKSGGDRGIPLGPSLLKLAWSGDWEDLSEKQCLFIEDGS